jgi:hypothetical protein
MRGIDIGLMKSRLYRISGVVDGVPAAAAELNDQIARMAEQFGGQIGKGKGKNKTADFLKQKGGIFGVGLNLVPRVQNGQQGGAGGTQVNADGTFEFRGVRPGAYFIFAQSRMPGLQQQAQLTARVPVDVGSGDLQNIIVRLSPPLAVTGKIAPEREDTNLKLDSLRLNFAPATPGPGGGQARPDIAADGAFQAQLPANTYFVELTGAPQGYYLKTVKLAGREMPDALLELSSTGGPVEVLLGADAGAISGRVTNARGDAAADVRVTVVPASGSPRRDLYKAANTAEDGSFTINGLPPGDYKVFAWETIEGNAWMDVDFRRPFESLSASAEVRGGLSPNVTIRMVGRDQLAALGMR